MARYQDENISNERYTDPPVLEEEHFKSSIPDLPENSTMSWGEDQSEVSILRNQILNSWNSLSDLSLKILDIPQLYLDKSIELGKALGGFASMFLSEKNYGEKVTVAEAEYKAKASYTINIERFRGELESLKMLYEIVKQRVDQLSTQPK